LTRQHSNVIQSQRQDVELLLIENDHATAEISLFGGQVLSYCPKSDSNHDNNRDLIWVSPESCWDLSKPVRGGVPICWPWFGQSSDPELPSHGYVRNQNWALQNVLEDEHATTLLLTPASTNGPGFEAAASLELRISIGRELTLTLSTLNAGHEPFELSCALHTYFRVSDVNRVRLNGLSGIYRDKTRSWSEFFTPEPYTITEETDRVHQNPVPEVLIVDSGFDHNISAQSAGHDSIVVWNPWDKAALMSDISPDAYINMLCVETALTRGFTLKPGSIHNLVQTIRLTG
jgi:glucose-6-phosphate 1-epimerase